MRTSLCALLLLLSGLSLASAAPQILQFKAQGLALSFNTENGHVHFNGERMPGSAVFADSKGYAVKLPSRDIVKIYAGPRYNRGQLEKTQAELNGMGEREAALFKDLAPAGLAPVIKESGFVSGAAQGDILFHAIAGVGSAYSGRYLMRRGAFHDEAVLERVRTITAALVANGHYVEKLNPTSFLFIRGKGAAGALLVKSYTEDAAVAPEERSQLAAHYAKRIKVFEAMSKVYPSLRDKEASLSPVQAGVKVEDEVQVLLMLWNAMLAKRQVKILYTNGKGETKLQAVWPVKGASPKDDLMKGYVRVAFQKGGKEFTYRLDRIGSAELLP